MRIQLPEESMLVGFTDDVAALIERRDIELAQLKLNRVIWAVNVWMTRHGLSLALNKTEIVVLTNRRITTSSPCE